MAVQKSRKTPSRRGMRRSHDALTGKTLSTDPTTVALIQVLKKMPDWSTNLAFFMPEIISLQLSFSSRINSNN